jgi:hypothetical protein
VIVSDILLNVLDLLIEEELILLRELIEINLIREIEDIMIIQGCRHSCPILIFLLLEVSDLLCQLLLKLLKNVQRLKIPLVRLPFKLSESIIKEHLD